MAAFWLTQGEYILRIALAGICGGVIGLERKSRLKVAGTRTHLLVALASSLMMVVSKYGFFDVTALESVNLDPSRIAAGIVTGVGFLGAGLIFVRKQEVSGVTTAAGVWATVGVGMAVGAGMYVIGVASTLLILLNQKILHSHFRWLREPVRQQVALTMRDAPGAVEDFRRRMAENKVEIYGIRLKRAGDGCVQIKMTARFPADFEFDDIFALLSATPQVQEIEI